jgi:hypothetical protein
MIIRNESGVRWLPVRIGDFEKWQVSLLEESARRVGAVPDPGGRVHRYGFVGSPVTFRGQRAWLRVSPFLEHEMSRKAWRGTAEAAAIPGVSKPALLHRIEWDADGPEPVPVSVEVLKLVTDPLASRVRFLRTAPDLPPEWFPARSASAPGYVLTSTARCGRSTGTWAWTMCPSRSSTSSLATGSLDEDASVPVAFSWPIRRVVCVPFLVCVPRLEEHVGSIPPVERHVARVVFADAIAERRIVLQPC